MFGIFLLALAGGGYWYLRRRRRGRGMNAIEAECPGELNLGQDRPDLLFQVKAITLQEAATPSGALYISLANLLRQSGYPCTSQQIVDMATALINLAANQPLESQRIAGATATRVPANLSFLATQYRQMGADENLSAFLNLAAIYLAEANAAGGPVQTAGWAA